MIGLTNGGHSTKIHAVAGSLGRPNLLFMTARQRSENTGARALRSDLLSAAGYWLADRGYDAEWFRNGLEDTEILSCIPSHRNSKEPIPHNAKHMRPV